MALQVITTFVKQIFRHYSTPYIIGAIVALLVLFIVKLKGFLNTGNLPKHGMKGLVKDENSPLNGKHIIFLGSSVTKGFAAYGQSFVDMIAARTGAIVTKEAVSGTTLVDKKGFTGESYIARMKTLDVNAPCDLFVCQLSTNDSTMKLPLGTVSDSMDLDSFDTQTVCGAIEYIIAYVRKHWNCPVAFYTNPLYGAPAYKAMVDALPQIQEKWGIHVIDMWHDVEANEKKNKKHSVMNDEIHPTRKGYHVWTPIIEEALCAIVQGKPVPVRPVVTPAVDDAGVVKLTKKNDRKKMVVRIVTILLVVLIAMVACLLDGFNDLMGLWKEGNDDQYVPELCAPLENSPLKGKTILFLGSSVTQGFASGGDSFVDYIEALDQATVIKEVYSATTVTNNGSQNSYNPRLRKYDAGTPVDAVVIQLSSNDSTLGASLGEISDSFDRSQIDDTNFTGGMECLIAYAKETWDCPVIIFSNPVFRGSEFYDRDAYGAMAETTVAIAEKWGATYLNMWVDEEMNTIPMSDYRFYMSDPVHPTKAGYLQWWTPKFQEALYACFE